MKNLMKLAQNSSNQFHLPNTLTFMTAELKNYAVEENSYMKTKSECQFLI